MKLCGCTEPTLATTLARDLGYLSENGDMVEKVWPVDMFPHTTHVETVVKLVK